MTKPEQGEVIEFEAPLPPAALRANFRGHWSKRTKAAAEYSALLYRETLNRKVLSHSAGGYHEATVSDRHDNHPWTRAKVSYEWRYCGTPPDLSNMGGHTKYLQDYLCLAPDIGLRANQGTYLGLIENDRGIIPSWTLVKVAKRRDELVRVRIERVP